ncbi:MAG: hypothetical protein HPY55_02745 [Firmicutes bacterium]|nr:hypothetical protein [Bacillota bacterium]
MDIAAIDLLNSDWHDYRGSGRRVDRLDDPEWLKIFVSRWGLDAAGTPGENVRASLKDLRALLRRIVEAVSRGTEPHSRDFQEFNKVLALSPVVRRLVPTGGGYTLEPVPLEKGWDWARAEIARGFAEVLAHGDPSRFKICENPDCFWVFYDESRNRSRRWCEDTCGNLLKVRRFRERRKGTTP